MKPTTKPTKKKKKEFNTAVAIIIILVFMFFLGLFYGKHFSVKGDLNCIPSGNLANHFCREQGYKSGYISSNVCDRGVQCYKELGDGFSKDKCFDGEELFK